ncbi:uncharacterized protein PFL1_02937 [Pseudozyma flocculosa PF-1]|uniref:Roadblock/LAMTOR2 domain-containing protein n=1 Tax=Pseudozyma flocculosa PF-1 TaxID=1277687 RepID=A0A061H9Z1_9BASI|nr:uncharacterized protein PFL1_02937 [Pseudozyma flocculosa PF-1]EPQ29717.1 hypothetical protein PFL1_02937 [Pseudozyma flocculosa PF-1]
MTTEARLRISPTSLEEKPHPLSTSPHSPDRRSPMPPAATLSLSNPSPPAEVEATLTRLTAHQGVLGCLVLSRTDGLVIRSGGQMFEPSGPGARERAESLKKVVRLVKNCVGITSDEVKNVDGSDELGFLRIRTRKYEIMITPNDKYLLVVLQDPTAGP